MGMDVVKRGKVVRVPQALIKMSAVYQRRIMSVAAPLVIPTSSIAVVVMVPWLNPSLVRLQRVILKHQLIPWQMPRLVLVLGLGLGLGLGLERRKRALC
jgi:Mg2+/citrate symporter